MQEVGHNNNTWQQTDLYVYNSVESTITIGNYSTSTTTTTVSNQQRQCRLLRLLCADESHLVFYYTQSDAARGGERNVNPRDSSSIDQLIDMHIIKVEINQPTYLPTYLL